MTEQYKMFSDKEAKGLGKKFIVYVCASLIIRSLIANMILIKIFQNEFRKIYILNTRFEPSIKEFISFHYINQNMILDVEKA